MRSLLVSFVVVTALLPGCRLFAEGIACDPDDPATCPDGTTCSADGVCVAGDDPVPGPPLPVCGDGEVNGDEACDFNGDDGCNTDCTDAECGDSKVSADEECDDGNDVDGDGCDDCEIVLAEGPPAPVCGDGIVNGTEACDFVLTPDACNTDCTAGSCGDGKVDGDEECDDANAVDGDGCEDCAVVADVPDPELCGDGVVNGTEDCEPSLTPDTCNADCTDGSCGDGKIDGDEECDDANAVDGDGCDDCALAGDLVDPFCGDGAVNNGEVCDPTDANSDACNSDCSASACPDGKLGTDEECDDGNNVSTDGCAQCLLVPSTAVPPVCGDGVQNGSEECDFADVPDDCNTDCTDGSCGDGKVDGDEECDDANSDVGDGCEGCVVIADVPDAPVCGDGIENGTEQCDFAAAPDVCNRDCTDGSCGDGKIDGDEECDDANVIDGDGCEDCAVVGDIPTPPICGDGVVNGSEECEPTLDPTGCNIDCTNSTCGDDVIGPDEECDEGTGNGVRVAVGRLDGVTVDSTMNVIGQAPLPLIGWVAIGAEGARITAEFGNGLLCANADSGLDNYTVQYATGENVRPNTRYTLRADTGFVAGNTVGGRANWRIQIGTLAGGVFTPLATHNGASINQGNLATLSVVSNIASVDVVTGDVVSGAELAVRMAQTATTGPDDFFGFDNVKLTRTELCSTSCVLPDGARCGDRVVDAGEECDGGTRCNANCTIQPSCFTTAAPSTFNTARAARVGAAADLDGDGDDDMVIELTAPEAEARVFETVAGVPTSRNLLPGNLQNLKIFRFADVNNDRRLDLIAGRFDVAQPFVVFLRNTDALSGNPFNAPILQGNVGGGATGATFDFNVVDVNNDGRLDIVQAQFDQAHHLVFLGNGDGTFTRRADLDGVSRCNVGDLATGDFDGDGDADLADVCFLSCRANIFTNDGTGKFTLSGAPLDLTGPASDGCQSMVTLDFDNDGDSDVLFSNNNPNRLFLEVLLNDRGTFTRRQVPHGVQSGITRLGDVDGDGRNDLVTAALLGVSVRRGRPVGFETRTTVTAGGVGTTFDSFPADLNADGVDEVIFLRNDNATHTIARADRQNNASIGGACYDIDTVLAGTIAAGSSHNFVNSVDVDGDGNLEGVLGSFAGNAFDIVDVVNGAAVNVGHVTQAEPRSSVLGDFDGDALLDIMMIDTGDGVTVFHKGNGTTTFNSAGRTFPFSIGVSENIAGADFDGDGRLDIAAGQAGAAGFIVAFGTNNMANNSGEAARTQLAQPFGLPNVFATGFRAADMDGDGDVDVFANTLFNAAANPRVAILRNNGGRTGFSSTSVLKAHGTNLRQPDVGDVDGDGDIDGVYGFLTGGQATVNGVVVLQNNGGQLAELVVIPSSVGVSEAHFVDVDGDGALDVAWSDRTSVQVAFNDGLRFERRGSFPLTAAVGERIGFGAGDYNGDGDVDFIATDTASANVIVLLSK